MSTTTLTEVTFAQLADRARTLAARGERAILGITGAPGSGKSTLAERLVDELGADTAVLVPMDGFHLAGAVLDDLGRTDRKGAHDTFDGWGYAALMHRIRQQRDEADAGNEKTIYAPQFRRDLEEPVGSAIPIHPTTPLIITEGNYLLLDHHPWQRARGVIDESWFLAPAEEQRLRQLIERHQRFGRSLEEARERSLGSDQRNAEIINATAVRADLVIRLLDPQ